MQINKLSRRIGLPLMAGAFFLSSCASNHPAKDNYERCLRESRQLINSLKEEIMWDLRRRGSNRDPAELYLKRYGSSMTSCNEEHKAYLIEKNNLRFK